MIPTHLTAAEAQHLIERRRAHLLGPEHLTTAQATYLWNSNTQCYERVHVDPTPVSVVVRQGDAVSLVEVLRRLSTVCGVLGSFLVFGGGLWYLAYWGTRDEWYCMVWTGGVCALFRETAQRLGYTPYSPVPIWIGMGLSGLSVVLRYLVRPEGKVGARELMAQSALTGPQAQDLVEQGYGRLHGSERLTTPLATYVWNATSQVYELESRGSIWE